MRSLMMAGIVCSLATSAAADVPINWSEPDEEFARTIVTEWQTAVREGKADDLVRLAGFEAPDGGSYVQVTVPRDSKLAKKCGKLAIGKNAKAVRASLPCLLPAEIVAAIAGFDMKSGSVSFAEKLADVLVESKQWTAARAQLKKFDKTHVFVNLSAVPGDGVWHQLVLAISVEQTTGVNRVGAVVHWTTPKS